MGKKILIIEDELILAEALKERLKNKGYLVETVYDGESGLEKIRKSKPDLLILDILLPGINGYEVMEKIRNEKIALPILVVSNSGQPVETEKARNLGANDFIIKVNFSLDDVEKRVKNLIG
jgi:DNA-binding response OmpR family regulator